MKKTVWMLIALAAAVNGGSVRAETAFDRSVFEKDDDYQIETEKDGSAVIAFAPGDDRPSDTVVASTGDDGTRVLGHFDISVADGGEAAFRMTLTYSGKEALEGNTVMVRTYRDAYTFEVEGETGNEDGLVTETYTLVFDEDTIRLVEDLIDSTDLPDFQLTGKTREIGGFLAAMDAGGLEKMYTDFREAAQPGQETETETETKTKIAAE